MSKESRSIGGEGAADTTSDSGDLPLCRFVDLALRRAPVLSNCDRMSRLRNKRKETKDESIYKYKDIGEGRASFG